MADKSQLIILEFVGYNIHIAPQIDYLTGSPGPKSRLAALD